jgi:pyruvate/2-oxoglutarate dehydrogenase complex dihydrolipoamide acyltransferase (E2) component
MAQVELIMPKMGESIMEATILKWLKKPGDKIEQDESVLEVATDKVDTEVPSTHAGVLKEILAKEGEVVKVGKAIAIITSDVVAGVETENVVVERKIIETQKEVSTSTNGTASHAAAVVAPTDFKNASLFATGKKHSQRRAGCAGRTGVDFRNWGRRPSDKKRHVGIYSTKKAWSDNCINSAHYFCPTSPRIH